MPEPIISFFQEEIDFTLPNQEGYIRWIVQSSEKEGVVVDNLNFIFCSDKYLLEMNKKYLDHHYFTDIITFDNSENENLSGDIFISVERAIENAHDFGVEHDEEIRRLIIHGVLHLVGYNDSTDEEKKVMRSKEDYYLSLWTI